MNIDTLADLLKSRGCDAVCYFHTDHFEPWSSDIDDVSARAVEHMAEMAQASPYARRLSLFYSVFIPYGLGGDSVAEGDVRVHGDGVVFSERSARREALAREAIRPLVGVGGHEIHLHVHHEFWTRNASHFDHPVSRWVNAHSSPQADRARLDLHFRLCTEAIEREIGIPFKRWAFIHGNWALNASDPQICTVNDEMAIILRHGGFGDFSFPAGRGHCDPKLETPFTCVPVDRPRAYDDPHADPRPIGQGTRVLRPDRFFIWNSPIKARYSSLDYYSAANRSLYKAPEKVVAAWLSGSVSLGRNLFIKTHAHSMKGEYELTEPGAAIPHTYSDVVAIFECLSRVCDRAGIELRFHTVNEVMDILRVFDGAALAPALATSTTAPSAPRSITATTKSLAKRVEASTPQGSQSDLSVIDAPPAAITPQAMSVELVDLHRGWIASQGAKLPPDDLYLAKLANNAPLEPYETTLAAAIAERYPPGATRIVEIGSGWAGFAILLARLGFDVLGFEGNTRRYAACRWHIDDQIRRFPALRHRLRLAPEGLFPEVFFNATVAKDRSKSLCITTNITSSYSAEHQHDIIQAMAQFDELIIDLARFGTTRNSQPERNALFQTLTESTFKPVERLFFQDPYEYWRFRNDSLLNTAARP